MVRDLRKELDMIGDEPSKSWHPEVGDVIVGRLVTYDQSSRMEGGSNPGGGRMMGKEHYTPHEKRRGWLRHGNPPGDFSKAPRCEARTRRGTPCQCPAMRNRRRCKLHGGLSTGPKTAEGIERIRRASTTHGQRTKAARAEREHFRALTKECHLLLSTLADNPQGDEP